MSNINSAIPAMAVVAEGKVRRTRRPDFRLVPVPVDAIEGRNSRVAEWARA